MSKLSESVAILFEENAAAKMAAKSRYESAKSFYEDSGIEIPVSLTFVQTKRANTLTKDETIAIQRAYIAELKAGNVSAETENNFNAIGSESEKVTFTDTLTFSEALKEKGFSRVASALIDRLPASELEKYNKVRREDVRPIFDKSEIPAIIKVLQGMMESK